jgi:hypothetical protein
VVSQQLGTRAHANSTVVERLRASDPVLVDILPAGEAIPGMTATTILTSGVPLSWEDYYGGQRRAILSAAVYERLAVSLEEADHKIQAGEIQVAFTHDHGCVGSVAGIYTASMPVFVVEDRQHGNRAFCNFYEGESRYRLNYGSYDESVRDGLLFLQHELAPVLQDAVRRSGGIELKPLIGRALRMGDELHSRNTAATSLFLRELVPHLLAMSAEGDLARVTTALNFLQASDYFFLRLSMAAAKASADAADGVPGSSVVTAMTISCREFAIRVSGLPGQWFRGSLPQADAKLFDGFTMDDMEWIGGESLIAETVGLGAFAQAAAFGLQAYQGGDAQAMVAMNESMYAITVSEHDTYLIPYFGFRGVPLGIDVHRVVDSGIVPLIDGGLTGKAGGQIGAGVLSAPMDCFVAARSAYAAAYPQHES